MPIFAHPRFGPQKKPVFCLRSKFLGMLPTCFFFFFYIDFVFFFMIFAYFPIFFVKFSAWANANWQISGVICCVSDDHPMQISHNFPTCTVEIIQHALCMVEIILHTLCLVEITLHALLYGWYYPIHPSVWLKLPSTPFCMVEIIQYTLLYGWNYPARPSVWLKLPCTPSCTVEFTQHALKGQKLLAQGSALGINDIQLTPCKGKSFTYRRGFSFFIRCILKLLPLQVGCSKSV